MKLLTRLAAAGAMLCLVAGPAAAHDYHLGTLEIVHPWTRPTPPGAPTAIGYVTIVNHGAAPDRLLGVMSPVVGHVEVHEMSMAGGVMRMRPVEGGIEVAAGKTVALAPGGYHLMLIAPKRRFVTGERVPATLRFEHAGTVSVEFVVEANAPVDHARDLAGGSPR